MERGGTVKDNSPLFLLLLLLFARRRRGRHSSLPSFRRSVEREKTEEGGRKPLSSSSSLFCFVVLSVLYLCTRVRTTLHLVSLSPPFPWHLPSPLPSPLSSIVYAEAVRISTVQKTKGIHTSQRLEVVDGWLNSALHATETELMGTGAKQKEKKGGGGDRRKGKRHKEKKEDNQGL